MSVNWTDDELQRIGNADELRIAGLRDDGSHRKLVTIWQVRVGDQIFVRSVRGSQAAWFRGTQERGEGVIESGGITKDVRFVRDGSHDDEIDAAYATKYGRGSEGVRRITSAIASGTTMRISPL
jgi:hypothetical protein